MGELAADMIREKLFKKIKCDFRMIRKKRFEMVIFFDIDDTLIDSESAHLKAIEQLCIENDFNSLTHKSFEAWITITNKYLKQYFEKKISLKQQRIFRIRDFWKLISRTVSEKEASSLYERYHNIFLDSCLAFPDVITVLNKLQNYKMGIISNGTCSDQILKLKQNNLFHFFEQIIISEQVGVSKPNKKIFSLAANKIGKPLSCCIYIGDSYENDYQGSLFAGMKGIWLDRKVTGTNFNGNKITSLHELENYLCL